MLWLPEWNEWKEIALDSVDELKPYHNIFNIAYYEEVVENHVNNKENQGNKIFSIVTLAKWLNYHKVKTQ